MDGQCLCGAVTITVSAAKDVEACHCGMCRRWGGGPLMTIRCGSDVRISGSDHLAIFDSSKWAERGFCKTCGTHLFYRLKPSNEYAVPAGLFQSKEGFEFTEQIFIDKKPPYYDFANATSFLTEAQVIQKYAPK